MMEDDPIAAALDGLRRELARPGSADESGLRRRIDAFADLFLAAEPAPSSPGLEPPVPDADPSAPGPGTTR